MELEDPYETELRRDGRGRPYIKEVDSSGELTGREVTYTRVTTFINCVDDKTAISQWQDQQLVKGLLGGRGLRFRAQASSLLGDDQKRELNALIPRIREAAGAEDQAAIGTAVHALTERHDKGLEIGDIDPVYQADLYAYIMATRYFKHTLIEQLLVNDALKTAGTPDRVTTYLPCEECGISSYIFDLKTGRVDGYTQNSMAMQLSIYAHSRAYDRITGERSDLPPICLHRGMICSLPAGTGEARMNWVDIAKGWRLVQVAKIVRDARRVKAGLIPFDPEPDLMGMIRTATTKEDLNALHAAYSAYWGPEHTAAGWEALKNA